MKTRSMTIMLSGLIFALAGAERVSSQCVERPSTAISLWTADGMAEDLLRVNGGTLEGGMGYSSGKVGQAFEFDGIDDYIAAGNGSSVRPDFPLSVDFWMFKASDSDFYGVASVNVGDNGLYSGFRVYVNGSGAVVTGVGNDQGCCSPEYRRNFFSPDGSVTPNEWHYVAVVFESATSHLIYVDGMNQATRQEGLATFMNYGSSNELNIGRAFDPNSDAYQFGLGRLDEIGLYQGMLGSSEILEIFMAGSNGQCRPAVAIETSTWGSMKARF